MAQALNSDCPKVHFLRWPIENASKICPKCNEDADCGLFRQIGR